jgi:glycosyltransferase involved in cell wall biosynthesis
MTFHYFPDWIFAMRNLMFFTHHLVQGGAEKAVRTLSEYINSHYGDRYTSYICVVYDDPEMHAKLSNVVVLGTKSAPSDPRFHKALNVLRQIREMRELKKKLHIDVCISFLPGADIINVFSGVGEKQIVSVRTLESWFTHSFFKKIYVETSYRRCDRIIAVSNAAREDCIRFFHVPADKITSIPNAVGSLRPGPGIDDEVRAFIGNRKLIITTARLNPEKGNERLIRSFAAAADRIPDACLLILGDGPLRASLVSLIKQLHMQDRILLPGRRTNPQDYLRASDLFVLPSSREGMPNSLLEAMACGLPVISCRNGAEEILRDNNASQEGNGIEYTSYGVLVPVDDEKALRDAITTMMLNSALREQYARRSLQRAKKYNIRPIAERWISEIEKTLRQVMP